MLIMSFSPFISSENPINHFAFYILQSEQNVERVLPYYRALRKQCYDVQSARQMTFEKFGLDESDFTDDDLAKLN